MPANEHLTMRMAEAFGLRVVPSSLIRLSVFSFMTGNNDMHLKNFPMLLQPGGTWDMAPAYDLLNVSIVNPDEDEELALPIDGKKKKLNRTHFQTFGKGLRLNDRQINAVFNRMAKNKGLA